MNKELLQSGSGPVKMNMNSLHQKDWGLMQDKCRLKEVQAIKKKLTGQSGR